MPFPPPDPSKFILYPVQAYPPIPTNRWARNGQYPDAGLMAWLASQANQAIALRGKELFRAAGNAQVTNSNATRNRWRFAGHTSPYQSTINVALTLAIENDRTSGHNPFGKLAITDPTGVTTYGSVSYYFGAFNGTPPADTPYSFGTQLLTISGVPADTDIAGLFTDNDQARIVSAVVYEVPVSASATNGYVYPSYHATSPILETDRSGIHTIGKNIWKRGSKQLLNWCTDLDTPITFLGVATKNVVNTAASTTVSNATPGYKLDTTYDVRPSQGGNVPIVIAMYGSRTGASNASGVQLKNASGTTVQVSGFPLTTPGWTFATTTIPATADKWDLQMWNNTTNSSLYAVSIWEYEA